MEYIETLTSINERLETHGITHDTSSVKEMIQSKDYESKLEAITKGLDKIGKATELLTTKDGVDMFRGILGVLSGFAMVFPVEGPIVSGVLDLTSSIVNVFCGSDVNIHSVVDNSINSALGQYEDSDLRTTAAGTVEKYKLSITFLHSNSTIDKERLLIALTFVKIYSGVEFLGSLANKIKTHSRSKDKNEALRAIEYTTTYVELAILRLGILHNLYNILVKSKLQKTATDVHNIYVVEEQTDRKFLEFLTKPEFSQALYFAYLFPSTKPHVVEYLKHLKIEMHGPELSSSYPFLMVESGLQQTTSIRSVWFRDAIMVFNNTESSAKESLFYFDIVSEIDSIYYIRSKASPSLYVYFSKSIIDNFCKACEKKPESNGQWKVIKLENGNYIMSNKEFPDVFMKSEIMCTGKIWYFIKTGPPVYVVTGCQNQPSQLELVPALV